MCLFFCKMTRCTIISLLAVFELKIHNKFLFKFQFMCLDGKFESFVSLARDISLEIETANLIHKSKMSLMSAIVQQSREFNLLPDCCGGRTKSARFALKITSLCFWLSNCSKWPKPKLQNLKHAKVSKLRLSKMRWMSWIHWKPLLIRNFRHSKMFPSKGSSNSNLEFTQMTKTFWSSRKNQ